MWLKGLARGWVLFLLLSDEHINKHHKAQGAPAPPLPTWPSVIRTHFKKAAPKPRPKKAAAAVKPDAAEEAEEAS